MARNVKVGNLKDAFGDKMNDPHFEKVIVWIDRTREKLGPCNVCSFSDAAFEPFIFTENEFGFYDSIVQKKSVSFHCPQCGVGRAKFMVSALVRHFFPGMELIMFVKIVRDISRLGFQDGDVSVQLSDDKISKDEVH